MSEEIFEAIAAGPEPGGDEVLASLTLASTPEDTPTTSVPAPVLSIAPPLGLGQAANPPWKLFDLHVDHLGSTRLVTDDSGAVTSRHDYMPFGQEISQGITYNTHAFTGHERDKATGLDYMLARYYGGSLPRFLSPDPITGASSDPQSLNRYAYARGNPLKYIDPMGLTSVAPSPSVDDGGLIRPGSPWGGGDGTWNPHDQCGPGKPPCFQRGQASDSDWDRFKKEARKLKGRIDANPRAKRWFEARFGVSLDEIFTDGKGPVVNIGSAGGNYGIFDWKTNEITLDPTLIGSKANRYEETLAHEVEHFARDSAGERGIKPLETPVHWDVSVLSQLLKYGSWGRDKFWGPHGPDGYMFTWLVFGHSGPF